MPSPADLLVELNSLLRMTAIEADIARHRSMRARDDAVRDELLQNARNADMRRIALQQAVSDLGGIPDLLGVALDRMLTMARTQVLDQALPIAQALMADLALEHQLRDRAAFARVLADAQGERKVVNTLNKVEVAHTAAIEWIETRLGEVALGGPSALRPTPIQSAAAIGQRVATLPSRAAAAGINRGIAVADRMGSRLGDRWERTREVAEATEAGLIAGRESFLRTTEEQLADHGEGGTVSTLHRVRGEMGVLSAKELPIQRFAILTAAQAIAKIQKLEDVEDLRAVRGFETEHKNRSSVLRAADRRVTELAREAMA